MHLAGNGFQCCPDNMALIHATGESHDRATGILIPVGCPQSGEGRYYIASIGVFDFLCHIFGICGRINDLQFIS